MKEVTNKSIKNVTNITVNTAQADGNNKKGKGKSKDANKACHQCQRTEHLKVTCFTTKFKSEEELVSNEVIQLPSKSSANT